MTLPRFYQVELSDRFGARRCLALDLVEVRAATDVAAIVRNVAAVVRTLDATHRTRTEYVDAPAPDAVLQPLWAYAWGDGSPNTARLHRHFDALRNGLDVHRFVTRTGSWVEGSDLVGRECILAELCSQLSAGGRIHLMAPRRYGKTSIVRAIQSSLTRDGRTVVRIDVESVDTVAGLVVRLVDEAFAGTEVLRGIDELRAWPPTDASPIARVEACRLLRTRIQSSSVAMLERICRELARVEAILLIDEFTRFVLETISVEHRSQFVRALGAIASTSGLAVMVCGSQGLRGFVDWHDLQPLRCLESVAVGPLESDVASVLVEELFYGEGYAPVPDAIQATIENVGAPIPYFLHGLVHQAIQEHRSSVSASRSPVDRATVGRAYERRLLDQEGNEFFRAFRLKERGYPDLLRTPAGAMLRLLSQSSAPVALEALRATCGLTDVDFELLLAALVEDYDIVQSVSGVSFRSKVMRERWARREAWLRGGDA